MRPEQGYVPDWRDAAAYTPLLEAERSIIAWEWLRRMAAYRAAAGEALEGRLAGRGGAARPEHWGLHSFEDPALAAPDARPVWTAAIHPFVLEAEAEPAPLSPDSFELARLASLATIVGGSEARQHLLLSDGLRTVRVDVSGGSLSRGPARLRYRIGGIASAEAPLLTLRRLLALCRTGRFAPSLHRPEPRARRWVLMLRAADALAAGATQREIAAVLLSRRAGEPRWRSETPSIRTQVQRLVAGARRMAAGAYAGLLA